jgi:hypothetical protein
VPTRDTVCIYAIQNATPKNHRKLVILNFKTTLPNSSREIGRFSQNDSARFEPRYSPTATTQHGGAKLGATASTEDVLKACSSGPFRTFK